MGKQHHGSWWRDMPPGRVSVVEGAERDTVLVALDPLPVSAPPVISYQPPTLDEADVAGLLLDELQRAAVGLFPGWLPGAEHIDVAHEGGIAAVRALAYERAHYAGRFGPFLADLAEDSLTGEPSARGHAPVVRARGLGWVIAESFQRPYAVLMIDVPPGLVSAVAQRLAEAAEWLANQSAMGVWFVGASLSTVDRFATVRVDLSAILRERTGQTDVSAPTPLMSPGALLVPPLAGRPRPDSEAELALEAALRVHDWASGRSWNQTYHPGPLAIPFRLDLWWKAERVVVEVDGLEHGTRLAYAADRRRDVQLQLDGYAVLRYTNEQVLSDRQRVVSEIRRLVCSRRPNTAGDQR